MKKKLKKWGNNLVVVFTQEDEEVYKLKVGDVIDLTITYNRTKKRKEKNQNDKK